MEANFNKITINTKALENSPHENLLANAYVTFEGPVGNFTIKFFTIWKSKYGGFNVEPPTNLQRKFCSFDKKLWNLWKEDIIEEYKKSSGHTPEDNIPVIKE